MHFCKTSCCAIQDINLLGDHNTPKDAMMSFCRQALLERPKFGRSIGHHDQIFSFYLFTAAIGEVYGAKQRPYGQEFYDYIIANGLGEVWQSPLRPNKAWHPEHQNQVYVWMPDHVAIRAWWEKNGSGAAEVETWPSDVADDDITHDYAEDCDEDCCRGDI